MYRKKTMQWTIVMVALTAIVSLPAAGKIIYVNDDAAGGNDGTSWADAYIFLQDALANAQAGDEIHVAEGVYKPDLGDDQVAGDRNASFELISDVAIRGGYRGADSSDPNSRNIEVFETVLSGDLEGNDEEITNLIQLTGHASRADNSIHVVTGTNTSNTAILDGFTIMAGNAYNSSITDPFHRDSTGGGLYCSYSDAKISNCHFHTNSAFGFGGAVLNSFSESTFMNVLFTGNSVDDLGRDGNACGAGGIMNDYSSATLIQCVFNGNEAPWAGAMSNYNTSHSTIQDCTFIENQAHEAWSGAILNGFDSDVTITGSLFALNVGNFTGGVHCYSYSDLTLRHCTFYKNSSRNGGGGVSVYTNNTIINSCIFWENKNNWSKAQIVSGDDAAMTAVYNNIEGGWNGTNNINVDPLFVDPENGDYHLQSQAGHWDVGSQNWILDSKTSPCIDTGNPHTNPTAESMPNGGRVNMGAYGAGNEASKSLSTEWLNLSDINRDGAVNMGDFNLLCQSWLWQAPWYE